jgi:hypothetical protein
MSLAEFILNKWAGRPNWDLESQKAVLLPFIDELGADAVGLLDRHLATVVRQENDTAAAGPSVKAVASSDDDVRYAVFDAAPWLAQADSRDIVSLAKSGWGGGHVAEWSSHHDHALARMFLCLGDANEIRRASGLNAIGFECRADEGQALAWLKEHRPHLHAELTSWPAASRAATGPALADEVGARGDGEERGR